MFSTLFSDYVVLIVDEWNISISIGAIILTLKTEVVLVTLRLLQLLEGLLWDETELRAEIPATNRLTHGTAIFIRGSTISVYRHVIN
jgi:hypothetical protein